MQNHERRKMWSVSRGLVREVYRASQRFPWIERVGLQSQIRRAAISIPADIAEGCSRDSSRELARFLEIALGSTNEVACLLDVALDLEMLAAADHAALRDRAQHVRAMLIRLLGRVSGARTAKHVQRRTSDVKRRHEGNKRPADAPRTA